MALVRVRAGGAKSPRGDTPPKPAPKPAPAPEKEEPKPVRYKVEVDVVNEAIVVAAAIALWADEDRRVELLRIPADDFGTVLYAAMWRGLQELNRKRLEYDPRTLIDLGAGTFGIQDLQELLEVHGEPPPALDHHIERLRWSASKIRVVKGPLAALLEAFESNATPPERAKLLALEIVQTLDTSTRGILRDDREVAALTNQRIDQRHDGIAIYPFGVDGLDRFEDGSPRMVPGAAPGGMTLITGVSGSGKSVLAKLIALSQVDLELAGRRVSRRVLYCSWEMGFERDLEVMAAIRLGLDAGRVRAGQLERDERENLKREVELLSKVIRFTDKPFANERRKWSNEEALDVLGDAIAASAADIVIVDLWKMLLRYTRPEDEELALNLQLKILQDTKCHGILLHQMNSKEVERRADPRPTRDALKGAGVYLERPDTIIAMHRPGYLGGKVPDNKAEAIILKQRDWLAPLAVEFDWNGSRQTLTGGRSIAYSAPGEENDIDAGVRGVIDRRFGKRDSKRDGRRPA